MFNHFWHKPLEAERDMQTDGDDATPVEYRSVRNASVVDEDREDKEEQEEEDMGEDDDEE